MRRSSRNRNRRVRPARTLQERRRRWRWGPRWLLPALITAVVMVVGVVIAGQFLTVKKVEVSGTANQDVTGILEVAGVVQGDRMARVDTGSAAAAVSQLPWVDTVTVSRSWPYTVKISVTEHIAVGFLEDGGTWILVDAEGGQFLRVDAPAPESGENPDSSENLDGTGNPAGPDGPDGDATDATDTTDANRIPEGVVPIRAGLSDEEAIMAAAEVLNAFSALGPELRAQLVEVDAPAEDSITLRFIGDREVFWGSSERAPEKAEATRVVLSREGARWNVSNPALPAVRG